MGGLGVWENIRAKALVVHGLMVNAFRAMLKQMHMCCTDMPFDVLLTVIYVEYAPVTVDSLLPARLWKRQQGHSFHLGYNTPVTLV